MLRHHSIPVVDSDVVLSDCALDALARFLLDHADLDDGDDPSQ